MAVVYFIRHGESQANAGEDVAHDPSFTGLTSGHFKQEEDKTFEQKDGGFEKAEEISVRLLEEMGWGSNLRNPSLIVASPMARAQQTAMPTRLMFSEVPFETWDNISEFTYLSPEAMQGTTLDQRKGHRQVYWQRCEPNYKDGRGAESFSELAQQQGS